MNTWTEVVGEKLISALLSTMALACTKRGGKGRKGVQSYLSFSLEVVDLVSRAMKSQIKAETRYTSYTLHKTA